jgi:hypothetical protein
MSCDHSNIFIWQEKSIGERIRSIGLLVLQILQFHSRLNTFSIAIFDCVNIFQICLHQSTHWIEIHPLGWNLCDPRPLGGRTGTQVGDSQGSPLVKRCKNNKNRDFDPLNGKISKKSTLQAALRVRIDLETLSLELHIAPVSCTLVHGRTDARTHGRTDGRTPVGHLKYHVFSPPRRPIGLQMGSTPTKSTLLNRLR